MTPDPITEGEGELARMQQDMEALNRTLEPKEDTTADLVHLAEEPMKNKKEVEQDAAQKALAAKGWCTN